MSSVLPENFSASTATDAGANAANFRPCAIIPVFNHRDALLKTFLRLRPHDLPIIFVDDASTDGGGVVLDEIAVDEGNCTVIHRPKNGGKGAAVMDGIRAADALGYTHALQIDADGQHEIEAVPKFLELGRRYPRALILGCPVFDASAPWGRVWGRKISNWLVRFETLRFLKTAPKDVLFGFRLYPIAEHREVFFRGAHYDRMEFDTEILVKLCWAGAEVKNIDTSVRYPEDGISHFRYFEDNLALICLHIGLILRMIPQLISGWLRRSPHTRAYFRRWEKHDERGSMFWVRFLFFAPKFFGTRFCNALAYPVIFYFILTNKTARGASRDYLRRVLGLATPEAVPFSAVYRHFLEFAFALVDRAAVWNGDLSMNRCRFYGKQPVRERIDRGEGVILLSAHFGNLEVCRALAEELPRLQINAMMYMEHAKKYNAMLSAANANAHLRVIAIEAAHPEVLVSLKAKLDAGECLGILADRITPGAPDKTASVDFLGARAELPTGPLIFASLLNAPVYLVFCVRAKDGTYDIYMEPFSDSIELPRARRAELLQAAAQRYADRLAFYCKKAPFQWFNYYYFWGK